MKLYFAQVMDNRAYLEHALKLLSALEAAGHSVYFPWRDEGVIIEDESTFEQSLKTFNRDVQGIKDCDAMVAYIDGLGPDSGTCVEVGIAYALGKPVLLYTTEFKYLPKGTDVRQWLAHYGDNVTFASESCASIHTPPCINNMLIGASGGRLAITFEAVLSNLAELRQ